MKDSNNKELKVGQTVVWSNYNTSCIYTAIVLRFTRNYVVIKDKYNREGRKLPGYLLILNK